MLIIISHYQLIYDIGDKLNSFMNILIGTFDNSEQHEELQNRRIKLTSYEIPNGYDKIAFTY